MRRGHRVRFPIVLVAVGVLAVGCGGDDDDDAQLANPASAYCVEQGGRVEIEDEPGGQVGYCELPDGSRVEEWELYRRSSTTTATAPCSGDPDAALASDPSLPAVVEAMRRDLAAAASTCDYAALQELVDRNGDGVRSTFGEQGDAVAAWRDEEETGEVEPMRALQLLLGLPAARTEGPDGATFVWPAAFATEHPSDDALREVADTGLYSMDQLQAWVDSGTNYLGYRVFITDDGDWTLFVDGD